MVFWASQALMLLYLTETAAYASFFGLKALLRKRKLEIAIALAAVVVDALAVVQQPTIWDASRVTIVWSVMLQLRLFYMIPLFHKMFVNLSSTASTFLQVVPVIGFVYLSFLASICLEGSST